MVAGGCSIDVTAAIRQYVTEHMVAFRFGGVRIDWLKPVLPLYAHAIDGATSLTWSDSHSIRVASAEGLILTKLIAFRPQDQLDMEVLMMANADELDVDLIRKEWSALAEGEDERNQWLESALNRYGLQATK